MSRIDPSLAELIARNKIIWSPGDDLALFGIGTGNYRTDNVDNWMHGGYVAQAPASGGPMAALAGWLDFVTTNTDAVSDMADALRNRETVVLTTSVDWKLNQPQRAYDYEVLLTDFIDEKSRELLASQLSHRKRFAADSGKADESLANHDRDFVTKREAFHAEMLRVIYEGYADAVITELGAVDSRQKVINKDFVVLQAQQDYLGAVNRRDLAEQESIRWTTQAELSDDLSDQLLYYVETIQPFLLREPEFRYERRKTGYKAELELSEFKRRTELETDIQVESYRRSLDIQTFGQISLDGAATEMSSTDDFMSKMVEKHRVLGYSDAEARASWHRLRQESVIKGQLQDAWQDTMNTEAQVRAEIKAAEIQRYSVSVVNHYRGIVLHETGGEG